MKFLNCVFVVLFCCLIGIEPIQANAMEARENIETSATRKITEDIKGAVCVWNTDGEIDLLERYTLNGVSVYYSYNEEGYRVQKNVNGTVTSFVYDSDGDLISETEAGKTLYYCYDTTTNYGYKHLKGIVFEGKKYFYTWHEDGTISGIEKEDGTLLGTYVYCDGIPSICTFGRIGNEQDYIVLKTNSLLYLGGYFDEETGCYYKNRRYYSVKENAYLDGNSDYIVAYQMPTARSVNPSVVSFYGNQASAWASSRLNSSTYGRPITYSANWYTTINDPIEVIARMIYAENPYENNSQGYIERKAIAWVVLNRVAYSVGNRFPNDVYGVCTQNNEFKTIRGEAADTTGARNPDTTALSWEQATYLACYIYATAEHEICEALFGKPDLIDDHMFFCSWGYYTGNSVKANEWLDSEGNLCNYLKEYVIVKIVENVSGISVNTRRNVFFNYQQV